MVNSTTTDPRYHGNEVWDKIGHNSTCIWDISEILAGGFRGQATVSNNVRQILRRPTPVAMATKLNEFVVLYRFLGVKESIEIISEWKSNG